jgi:hypothetical protein
MGMQDDIHEQPEVIERTLARNHSAAIEAWRDSYLPFTSLLPKVWTPNVLAV